MQGLAPFSEAFFYKQLVPRPQKVKKTYSFPSHFSNFLRVFCAVCLLFKIREKPPKMSGKQNLPSSFFTSRKRIFQTAKMPVFFVISAQYMNEIMGFFSHKKFLIFSISVSRVPFILRFLFLIWEFAGSFYFIFLLWVFFTSTLFSQINGNI